MNPMLHPIIHAKTRCSVLDPVWYVGIKGRKEELGGWREAIDGSGVSDEGKKIGGQPEIALSVGMCVQQLHSVPRFDEDRIRGEGMRMRSETGC